MDTSLSNSQQQISTTLGTDTHFKGNLNFENALRIDGKLEGEMSSPGFLHIGKDAELHAEIRVGSIMVEGTVHGNIEAGSRVELAATAKVFGDVKASRLIIQDGATFVGRSDVDPEAVKKAAAAKGVEPTSKGTPSAREPELAKASVGVSATSGAASQKKGEVVSSSPKKSL